MRITALLLGLLFFASQSAVTAELDKISDARKLVADVMALIVAGNMPRALQALESYSTVPTVEFDLLSEQILEQGPALEERFGRTIAVELIGEEERGDSLYSVKYLQKFQKHAVIWHFVFYKPARKWVLASFASEANLGVLFQ